jgi:hypothetical protein
MGMIGLSASRRAILHEDQHMAQLPGLQFEQLSQALRDAFDYSRLKMVLRYRLDKKIEDITLANNYEQVVFDIIERAEAGGWTDELLRAARESNPRSPSLLGYSEQYGLAPIGTPPHRDILERYIKPTNAYLDVEKWRTRLGEIEGQVCRIEINTGPGMIYGTGFLLGPDVVITNYHVMDAVIGGEAGRKGSGGFSAQRKDVTVRFDFKRMTTGRVFEGTTFSLAHDWLIDQSPPSRVDFEVDPKSKEPAPDELDYALIRLESDVGNRPIGAKAEPGSPKRGWLIPRQKAYNFAAHKALFIVQHPEGDPLKLALDTEAAPRINGNATRVRYGTNTEKGSSGSPCFNVNWELVALHHSGDPNFAPDHSPQYNEGIPFRAILDLLERRKLASALGDPVNAAHDSHAGADRLKPPLEDDEFDLGNKSVKRSLSQGQLFGLLILTALLLVAAVFTLVMPVSKSPVLLLFPTDRFMDRLGDPVDLEMTLEEQDGKKPRTWKIDSYEGNPLWIGARKKLAVPEQIRQNYKCFTSFPEHEVFLKGPIDLRPGMRILIKLYYEKSDKLYLDPPQLPVEVAAPGRVPQEVQIHGP